MEERRFHPLDYVSVLRRRKWWFVAPLVLSIVVGAALAMLLPREYTSEAEIGIADPTLSPELLRGVQSLDAEERQRAISQQLLSRSVLERVVREENLSPGKPVEQTAAALRSNVEKHIVVPQPIGRMGQGREGADSFRLGYVDADARSRAAHHQPARHRVRRGELQDEDAAGAEHLGSARPAAEGEPGAAGEAAGAAADEEAGEHRPAARPDERQRVDGQRPAHSSTSRCRCSCAPSRTGCR